VAVTCVFIKNSDGLIEMTIKGFNVSVDEFYEIQVPKMLTPRTTA